MCDNLIYLEFDFFLQEPEDTWQPSNFGQDLPYQKRVISKQTKKGKKPKSKLIKVTKFKLAKRKKAKLKSQSDETTSLLMEVKVNWMFILYLLN